MADAHLHLHDVVVTNDQTGAAWLPARAEIRAGLIVAHGASAPPPSMFARPVVQTFTIVGKDGVERTRVFTSTKLEPAESRLPKIAAFR